MSTPSQTFLSFAWWRLLLSFTVCPLGFSQHCCELLLREIYVRRITRRRFRYSKPEPYATTA